MIYHYMGAEVEIIELKPKQVLKVKTKDGGYVSEHHISEFKADAGIKEINESISKLDKHGNFWTV